VLLHPISPASLQMADNVGSGKSGRGLVVGRFIRLSRRIVAAVNRLSCARSILAPLATSRNTFPAPAARSWRTCAASLCPSVDTRA
jgi:hypothetical protein